MAEENRSEGKAFGGPGIVAEGNVTITNNASQLAVGTNINQVYINQVQSMNQLDFKELREGLLELQKGIDKLGLEPDDQSIVSGNISAAVKEAKKEDPQLSKIKGQLEGANEVIKEAGKTISSISELYEPAKKIAKTLGIAASIFF